MLTYCLTMYLEKENILIHLSTVSTKEKVCLMEIWHLRESKGRARIYDDSSTLSQQPSISRSWWDSRKSVHLLTPHSSMDLFQVLVQTLLVTMQNSSTHRTWHDSKSYYTLLEELHRFICFEPNSY